MSDHLSKDCKWPRAWWGLLWLRVLAWLYLPYGLWVILQQIAKMRSSG